MGPAGTNGTNGSQGPTGSIGPTGAIGPNGNLIQTFGALNSATQSVSGGSTIILTGLSFNYPSFDGVIGIILQTVVQITANGFSSGVEVSVGGATGTKTIIASNDQQVVVMTKVVPSAGSHTYSVAVHNSGSISSSLTCSINTCSLIAFVVDN
jgi:hypothetical protein